MLVKLECHLPYSIQNNSFFQSSTFCSHPVHPFSQSSLIRKSNKGLWRSAESCRANSALPTPFLPVSLPSFRQMCTKSLPQRNTAETRYNAPLGYIRIRLHSIDSTRFCPNLFSIRLEIPCGNTASRKGNAHCMQYYLLPRIWQKLGIADTAIQMREEERQYTKWQQ